MSRRRTADRPAVWRTPVTRRLLSAQAASVVGDWLYGVAVSVAVYRATHSPAWLAGATAARMVPYVIAGPIVSGLADRYDRRRLMIVADLVRTAIMGALAAAAWANAAPAALAFLVAASATVTTAYAPALAGLVPDLVSDDALVATNAAISTIHSAALMFGPAAGSLLVLLGSPALAFAVNGLTFAVSAALVVGVPTVSRTGAGSGSAVGHQRTAARLVAGATTALQDAHRRALVASYVALSTIYGVETVLLLLASDRLLGTGASGLGWLLVAAGVGGVWMSRASAQIDVPARLHRMLGLALVAAGTPTALLAVVTNRWLAYGLLAIDGAANVVIDVLVVTGLQRAVPAELVSRVYGFLDAAGVVGILAGTAAAPILVKAMGLRAALAVGGGTIPLISVALLPVWASLDRNYVRVPSSGAA